MLSKFMPSKHGKGVASAAPRAGPKGVAEAVLDIMEGSEQAFKKRSEKYHF
jgi:hypothetical protein